MAFELRYSDEAVKQLKGLRAFDRAAVIDQIEKVLAVNPTLVSKVGMDDDLLDYLLERSPKFVESCQQIRERMRSGRFHTHADVKKLLESE